MMDSILFLHEHSSYKIEKQVFKDFNMLDMLGDDIVAVLSIPCNEDEILERQNIFKDLYDENFYNSLYTFRNHLAEMKRTKDILYSYDQNIGCFFIFAKYVRSYIDSIRSVYNVVSSSRLISQLYNAVDKYAEKFSLLDSLYSRYNHILNSLRDFDLNMDYGLLKLCPCKDKDFVDIEKSLKEKLLLCQYELGYGKLQKQNFDIQISATLSEAIEVLHKEKIADLKKIKNEIIDLLHDEITDYIWQIDFYIKIHALLLKADQYSIPHCFPSISKDMECHMKNVYDITLIFQGCQKIIPNDIHTSYNDNVFFVLGANGGGKTTYLRAIGVNLIFFSCGCPVFCDQALIFPPTKIYTHFPIDETYTSGRFDAEVLRLNEILKSADTGSWVFLNETFYGTNSYKGVISALDTMKKLKEQNVFCLFVTHFFELINKGFPSLNVIIDKNGQNKRTFRVERSDFAKSSFSQDILKKYNLDFESLQTRYKSDF